MTKTKFAVLSWHNDENCWLVTHYTTYAQCQLTQLPGNRIAYFNDTVLANDQTLTDEELSELTKNGKVTLTGDHK